MKSNNSGFTLIELMIVVAIIGIAASVGLALAKQYFGFNEFSSKNQTVIHPAYTQPANDPGTRCVVGYMVIYGADGSATQMIDENKVEVKCP